MTLKITTTVLAALTLSVIAYAHEPADPSATIDVPLKVDPTQKPNNTSPSPRKKIPFLGVSIMPVPGPMREQMGLPVGEGVMVRNVLPDTAADDAGLEAWDVIHKIDGLVIHGPEELKETIRNRKFGQRITIDFKRGNEAVRINTTLGEREHFDDDHQGLLLQQPPNGLQRGRIELLPQRNGLIIPPELIDPRDPNDLLRGLIEPRRLDQQDDPIRGQIEDHLRRMQRMREENRQRLRQLELRMNRMNGLLEGNFHVQRSMNDGQHRITITKTNGDTKLKVLDATGKVLYDGPINTAQEKAKVPAEVLEKVRRFQLDD